MKPAKEKVLVFENDSREKVYLGTTMFEPVLEGGEWVFAEPSDWTKAGYARIAVRPFRYRPLPLLVYGGAAVAWGVFARAKGGTPHEVWIRTQGGAQRLRANTTESTSSILGPDGRPAR